MVKIFMLNLGGRVLEAEVPGVSSSIVLSTVTSGVTVVRRLGRLLAIGQIRQV